MTQVLVAQTFTIATWNLYINSVKGIHPMTITERNQRLYHLRKEMYETQQKLDWIKNDIRYINDQYDRENRVDLFTEMFGGWLSWVFLKFRYKMLFARRWMTAVKNFPANKNGKFLSTCVIIFWTKVESQLHNILAGHFLFD